MTNAIWFPSARGGADHFATWDQYRATVLRRDSGTLWDILQARAKRAPDPMRIRSRNQIRESDTEQTRARKELKLLAADAAEIPWMTFVLGTGCLSAADARPGPSVLSSVRARVAESLSTICDQYPELALDLQATDFLELLAVQKTELASIDQALAAVVVREDVKPPQYSAQVLLAAALATQLYGFALVGRQQVLQRADREEVRFSLDSPDGVKARSEIITPLKDVLDLLIVAGNDVRRPPQQRALKELAQAVQNSVASLRIRRLHVELLTSFAWYFFTAGTRVYPSWSELMLLRSFDDDEWFKKEVLTSSDTSPRPRIAAVSGQTPWVRDRIIEVTNESWKSRDGSPGSTERDRFYDLIAKFLHQQAAASLPEESKPPLPTCFVTSFDLELEMALWQQERPFIVILPIFALDKYRPGDASLHWVWTVVDPSHPSVEEAAASGEDIRLELPAGLWRPGGWRVLSDAEFKQAGRSGTGRMPIVVRLTGSPLMDTPRVDRLQPTPDTEALHHALLLDEYIAIHQASLDLATPAMSGEGNSRDSSGSGLPTFLSTSNGGPSRFWVFLGTQLGDTGVRLRLTAQQLAHRVRPYQAKGNHVPAVDGATSDGGAAGEGQNGGPDTRTQGVLINAVSQASDRELFLWQDFDVVDDQPLQRTSDLEALHGEIGRRLTALANKMKAATYAGEANAR